MASHVLGDERAPGNEPEAAAPDVGERTRDQTHPQPAPFQSGRDLRVHEHDHAGLGPVPELTHTLPVEEKLVPELGRVVPDIHLTSVDHTTTLAPCSLNPGASTPEPRRLRNRLRSRRGVRPGPDGRTPVVSTDAL
jgi:hypothetical protein